MITNGFWIQIVYEEHLQEYSGLDIASKIALFLSRHLNARKSVTKSAERP